MQRIIVSFLLDLKKEIKKSPLRKEIVSVVLIGSAARGDWIRGESDVDFIIVARSRKSKDRTSLFFRQVLRKLDKKYNMQLKESCTDEKKFHSSVLNALLKIESGFLFGVPYYVISQEEFDLLKQKVSDRKIWFMMTFVGSLSSFLKSIKKTGVTVYGKDLVKQIKESEMSFFDHLKIFLDPYYLLFLGFLFLAYPKIALKHGIKACLMESDKDLELLRRHLGSYEKEEKIYEKLFSHIPFDTNHLKKCIYYRKNFTNIKPGFFETLSFLLKSFFFVLTSHVFYVLNLAKK